MKKFIIMVLCLFLVLLTGCSVQYKRISFDSDTLGEMLSSHINEDTQVIYMATERFSSEFPVYKISKNNISENELNQMMENLSFSENRSSFKLDGNKLTGTLVNYTDTSRGYFDMSDEELEKLAWDTFNKLPFIEGSYEYLGIKSTDTISSATETNITRVGVSFRRKIDDIRIVGDDKCYLYFDGSGLVEINVELYNYEKIDTFEMIPIEIASKRIKSPDSLSIGSETSEQNLAMIDTLQVERVKLLYVNQYRDDCEILQPVYSFMGVAKDTNGEQSEFNSLVIAIPETYTNGETY